MNTADGPLAGRGVLLTGGGSGIGRATALALAHAGARVMVVGRRAEALQETASLVGQGAPPVECFTADVTDPGAAAAAVRAAEQRVGPLAVLVNNAGANHKRRTFADVSVEEFDRIVRVNLSGAFYFMHAVLPGMAARGGGLVVNVSSVSALRAYPMGGVAYCAGKFGLNAVSTILSAEGRAAGVRSTVICPGEVDTDILAERPEPVSAERRAAMLRPEDVAAAVVFVACLPPHVHVPELVIKPTAQEFV